MSELLWLTVLLGTVLAYLVGLATGWTIAYGMADREIEEAADE